MTICLTCLAGTLFRASQFLSEELPIRLAHRVRELEDLPDGVNDMPSVIKVKDWYAQSFEVSIGFHNVKALPVRQFSARDASPIFPGPFSLTRLPQPRKSHSFPAHSSTRKREIAS